MAKRSTLKASDSEREQIADRLRQATAEGRLLAEELEERLMRAFKARTYGELDALVSDLPTSVAKRQHSGVSYWAPRAVALAVAVVAMMAVLVIAAFIITSVLAVWLFWAAIGWWFFGRGRHRGRGIHGGRRAYGRHGKRLYGPPQRHWTQL